MQHDDRTLHSPEFGVWIIQALESGMSPDDLAALQRIRMRLLGASTICAEVVRDAPPDAVVRVFEQICRTADRNPPRSLTWPLPIGDE